MSIIIKDILAGNPYSKRKKLILLILASILIIGIIIGIALAVNSRKQNSNNNVSSFITSAAVHTIAKSSCSSTLYPELCYSSIAQSLDDKSVKIKSKKDVIIVSLNVTIEALKRNRISIRKFITIGSSKGKLTEREKTALHDCLVTIDESVDELHAAVRDLKEYPSIKSIRQHADDLKTLLSSAITNQETCLDGFTYNDAEKHVREVVVGGQVLRVERLCSNSLAMICNMTDTDLENERKLNGGRSLTAVDRGEFPDWVSPLDRRLLQSSNVTAHAVVAADGSGDYRTVSEAVAAAPQKSKSRYVIRIKAGVYRENVEVPKKKTNIMFMGEGRTTTIITGNKNVQDGSTTFHSATVAAVGERFLARDITFENTAGPAKHQAVALRVGSDLSAFYRCDILAYQDTLYVHSNRHFFVQCLIVGTVDFIFGNGAAVLQDCDIHARRPEPNQKNMITAQGRTDPNQNTGIVLHRCRIGATSDLMAVQGNFSTYLGRPWKEYSRTVIMQSTISDVVHPTGWHDWNGSFALDTLYYGEYENTGGGARTGSRVSWPGYKLINSSSEAESYTAEKFISGASWLNSTGFPFILGL